jgi:internalin A
MLLFHPFFCILASHGRFKAQRLHWNLLIPIALSIFISKPLRSDQTPQTDGTSVVEKFLIDFYQPSVKEGRFKPFAFDTYRDKHGLLIGSIELVGKPVVDKTVQLLNPVAAFGVSHGRSQRMLTAARGGSFDLLLTFETPVTSVSVASDPSAKTPGVIRMLVVEPVADSASGPNPAREILRQVEVRVLALVEKADDAKEASSHSLFLDLGGKPIHHVILECTKDQARFDDLQFTRNKTPSEVKEERDLPLFNWELLARINGLDEQNISASWGNSTSYTYRNRVSMLPKETYSLELKDSGFTDAEMVYVGGMKNLRRLGLGGTAISDEGLKELRGLTELQRLDLRASRTRDTSDAKIYSELKKLQKAGLRPIITDVGLGELTALQQLRWLDLTDTQITDVGLAALKGLTNLEELGLANTAISTTGVKELFEFKHLRHLDLWQTKVDEAGINELLKIKSLRHIVVGAAVTREGIERLHKARGDIAITKIGPEYQHLEGLILSGRIPGERGSRLTIGDSPLGHGTVESKLRLHRLPSVSTSTSIFDFVPFVRNLSMFDATDADLADAELIAIGKQENLLELKLGGTHVTDQGLAHIGGLPKLRVLDLTGSRLEDHAPKWAGGGLFSRGVEQLRKQQASGKRPRITNAGLQNISSLKTLEVLNLYASQITDSGIEHLHKLRNLKTLGLAYTGLTNAAIPQLVPLEHLEFLDLVGTQVNDEGLFTLSQLKNLKRVRVDSPITAAGISKAKQMSPNCEFTVPKRVDSGR